MAGMKKTMICGGVVAGHPWRMAFLPVLVGLALMLPPKIEAGSLTRIPQPKVAYEKQPVEADFQVTVNGQPLDVLGIPRPSMHDGQLKEQHCLPYYAAMFEADEEVEVAVESVRDVTKARILPLARGIRPKIESAHRLTFRAKPPFKVSVEPEVRHRALVLAAYELERDVPAAGTPGVRRFEAGRYHFDKPIVLKSNETLYLAPGAWVESAVKAVGTNITIRGRGVLSGLCWEWCKGPGRMIFAKGEDITLRDITIVGSWQWTVVLEACNRAHVSGVNILNGHVLNDDAIDVCRSRNVRIDNCFIRAQDDCVAVKYSCDGIRVEDCALWADVANNIRIGFECEGAPKAFRNVTFRNIDILHQAIHKPKIEYSWAENVVKVEAGNDMVFSDFLFDTFRIDAPEPGDHLVSLKTVRLQYPINHHEKAGFLRNVTFRNFQLPKDLPEGSEDMIVWAYDKDHPIENWTFENKDPRIRVQTRISSK